MRLRSAVTELRRGVHAALRSSAPRDLQGQLDQQSTEHYWRRRDRSRRRRFRLVARWHGLRARWGSAGQQLGFLLGAFRSVLGGFAFGGFLIGVVLVVEVWLARYAAPSLSRAVEGAPTLGGFSEIATAILAIELIPSAETTPPLSAFPTLAVQVSASLLGFYLASVGIVLGTSYHDAPSGLRSLVLGNPRTRFQLSLIGTAIGAGLSLVSLQSLGVPYGYGTVLAYGVLVLLGGWAFGQLAFGAFDLFDPIALAREPLAALQRTFDRIGPTGLAGDEAVLRAAAVDANRALRVLAELIESTSRRTSGSPDDLAGLAGLLLGQIQFYAGRKHLLAPANAWFLPEPVYPRWIETEHSEVSLALQTSTPLRPRMEPSSEWLEKRSAELVAEALEACVVADSQESALRITGAVALTAQALASRSRLDEALVLSGIVRDRCWSIQHENATATAVAAGPPVIMASLVLGWLEALNSWGDEIRSVVAATEWDRADTGVVPIRGPTRVSAAAQRLLREVQAELDIEGRRVTPDSYLEFALAGEYFSSLQDFVQKFPEVLIEYFAGPGPCRSSPELDAMVAAQALQALAKAELVASAIPRVVNDLNALRGKRDPLPTEELGNLAASIQAIRLSVLERVADAITQIRPVQSTATPDLFGEAWFTLVHHAEQAIANGDVDLVQNTFAQVVTATFVLHDHILSTYTPPTYEVAAGHLDPMIDALELSGLALIYEVLRGDESAAPVRHAWTTRLEASGQSEVSAKQVLDLLDLASSAFALQLPPRGAARSEWGLRLARRIIDDGYARPGYLPFEGRPPWTAPPLIKVLGVDEAMPSLSVDPRAIFAAEVLGPLSGESEELLRARPGLRRYFAAKDVRGVPGDEDTRDDDPCHARRDRIE